MLEGSGTRALARLSEAGVIGAAVAQCLLACAEQVVDLDEMLILVLIDSARVLRQRFLLDHFTEACMNLA